MKIAFDFDGTLVDSMPALRERAVSLISETYGKTYEQADVWYMSTIGRSFREQIDFLFKDDARNQEIAETFYYDQAKIYTNTQLHFGVVETFEFLQDRNIPWAICTSSPQRLVRSVVDRLLPEFEGTIYGREDGPKRAQLRDANPSDFIGDTVFDCLTAQRLGIRFTGVTHTLPLNDVKRMGAPVADSIPQAIDLIMSASTVPEISSQAPLETV